MQGKAISHKILPNICGKSCTMKSKISNSSNSINSISFFLHSSIRRDQNINKELAINQKSKGKYSMTRNVDEMKEMHEC
jgi:hypothetical protein